MRNAEEFWDLFDKMVQEYGASERKFCQDAKIKQTTLNMAKQRGAYPNLEVMAKISMVMDISINEMLGISSRYNTNPDEGISIPYIPQKFSCGPGEDWRCDIETTTVTVMERMAAGQPIESLVAANVKGDSMIGANLYDGDLVIFSRGYISGNGIYAIAINGEVYVKRLSWNPFTNKVTIISENPAYEPMSVDADDGRLTILGKVTGWMHTDR